MQLFVQIVTGGHLLPARYAFAALKNFHTIKGIAVISGCQSLFDLRKSLMAETAAHLHGLGGVVRLMGVLHHLVKLCLAPPQAPLCTGERACCEGGWQVDQGTPQ